MPATVACATNSAGGAKTRDSCGPCCSVPWPCCAVLLMLVSIIDLFVATITMVAYCALTGHSRLPFPQFYSHSSRHADGSDYHGPLRLPGSTCKMSAVPTLHASRRSAAMTDPQRTPATARLRPLPAFIFMSRWLQLPLYLGLILAQCVYVLHFWVELKDLIGAALGNDDALQHIIAAVAVTGAPVPDKLNETTIMLVVLGLIDVVMISNLLVMVIIGGYETFVSRLNLEGHPDQPEWLSHVNASVLKIKLAMAIIGISSIHLLRTFIEAGVLGSTGTKFTETGVMWQTIIHCVFVLSAIGIAAVDRLGQPPMLKHH